MAKLERAKEAPKTHINPTPLVQGSFDDQVTLGDSVCVGDSFA
jgi:hypothetical protein